MYSTDSLWLLFPPLDTCKPAGVKPGSCPEYNAMVQIESLKQKNKWITWRLNQCNPHNCGKAPENQCVSCPLNKGSRVTEPIQASDCGEYASPGDPTTWASYDEALIYHERSNTRTDGVAYMLSSSGPIVGIVLERCRDPETGEIDTWAQEIVDHVNTYTEITEAGTDLQLFAATTSPATIELDQRAALKSSDEIDYNKQDRITIHEEDTYLIYTGRQISDTPDEVQSRPEVIEEIRARYLDGDGRDRSVRT